MFVAWELAHVALHQCSLFSGRGPLPEGFVIDNLQMCLKKYRLQESHWITYF